MKIQVLLNLAPVFAVLSSCGGGGTSSSDMIDIPAQGATSPYGTPSYESFASTADETSELGVSAIRSGTSGTSPELQQTTGIIVHNNGEITINGKKYARAPDITENGAEVFKNGDTTLLLGNTAGGAHEFMKVLFLNEETATGFERLEGIVGITTQAEDIPKSGKTTYRGGGNAVYVSGARQIILGNGSSTVSADFDAGTVGLTMDGFTALDRNTGEILIAPIDKIEITDMAISGNRFSGGTLQTIKNNSAFNATGANAKKETAGQFFGYDSEISAPDEVGGVFFTARG